MNLTKRQTEMLKAIKAGNPVVRVWRGTNRSGRLVHKLEGFKMIRESDVEALRRAGYLKATGRSVGGFFANLVWTGKD